MDIDVNENNEQQFNNNKNKTKNKNILKIALIVFVTIILICIAIISLYKALVDVSDDNSNKFDYNLNEIHEINEYDYKDFVSYDSNVLPDALSIDIPKNYFYTNILKIDSLNALLQEKYNLYLNRFGLVTNIQKQNTLDFYADCSKNNGLDMYITGSIRYEYTQNNGINIYMDKIIVGDGLPMFIYKAFLPINDGDLIYEIKANDYEFLRNKILKLSSINNLKITNNDVKFNFKYMDSVNEIIKYIFGDNSTFISNQVENYMPIILELLVGNNKEEFMDFGQLLLPNIDY